MYVSGSRLEQRVFKRVFATGIRYSSALGCEQGTVEGTRDE